MNRGRERDIQPRKFALWSQSAPALIDLAAVRPTLPLLILLGALASCRAPLPQPAADAVADPGAQWREAYRQASDPAVRYALDPGRSRIRIHAFRGGAAARAGHNHVLDAPRFEGYVRVPGEDVSQSSFELRLRLDELRIDDPALRAETGGNFAGERSASDIEGTRRNLLGKRGFDAQKHPEVRIRSRAISGDWPVLVAEVEVTLHGQQQVYPVMLRVERTPGELRVRGEFVLRQTDFGATPFSLLGGVLTVQDAVAISVDLVGAALPASPAGP